MQVLNPKTDNVTRQQNSDFNYSQTISMQKGGIAKVDIVSVTAMHDTKNILYNNLMH